LILYLYFIDIVRDSESDAQALGKYEGFGSNFRPRTICGTHRSAINLPIRQMIPV